MDEIEFNATQQIYNQVIELQAEAIEEIKQKAQKVASRILSQDEKTLFIIELIGECNKNFQKKVINFYKDNSSYLTFAESLFQGIKVNLFRLDSLKGELQKIFKNNSIDSTPSGIKV